MTTELQHIAVPDAPAIDGLIFRLFRGADDLPHIVAIDNASFAAGNLEFVNTVEELANEFAYPQGFDPARDVLIAEIDGHPVGYTNVQHFVNDDGQQILWFGGFVLPEWHGRGLGTALVRWSEERLREVAAEHPHDGPRLLQCWAPKTMPERKALLEREGFQIVRYGYQMVRSLGEPIPELPLPAGIEVRPATREQYRAIWEARNEAFRDHWGHREGTENDYKEFVNWPLAQPELWQVAWDTATDAVAGQVQVSIFKRDNETFGTKRGFTDPIFVRRPYRKRGLAKALIVRALRVLKEEGMEEASLFVDAQNPNGALRLYEGLGYRVYRETFTYRKPL